MEQIDEQINDIVNYTFFGNSLEDWTIAFAIAVGAMIGFYIARSIILARLSGLMKGKKLSHIKLAFQVLKEKTSVIALLVFSIYFGELFLDLPEKIDNFFKDAVLLAFLIQIGIWACSYVGGWIEQYRERRIAENPATVTGLNIIRFIAYVVIWSGLLLWYIDNLGFDITALAAGLGIGGIAVALALQNILGDLFASLTIVFDKPFANGDFLIVDTHMGAVESIGLKTTRIRSLSGEQIVFSNTDLLSSRVRNYGRMYERRVPFIIGVTYDTPREKLEKIPGIIKDAIEAQEKTRFDRSHFQKFGDFSLDFESVYYVLGPDYNVYMDIQQAINLKIHEEFEKLGIEFAFPTQTLYTPNINIDKQAEEKKTKAKK